MPFLCNFSTHLIQGVNLRVVGYPSEVTFIVKLRDCVSQRDIPEHYRANVASINEYVTCPPPDDLVHPL